MRSHECLRPPKCGNPGRRMSRARMCGHLALLLALCFTVLFLPVPGVQGSSGSGAVKRSSSAIAITSDGHLVLAINPDSDSLSLVDTSSAALVAELPVGIDPRTVAVDDAGAHAYVVNWGSDSLSVVDLPARAVVAEIPVGDRPYGVVVSPDGSRLYVAVQGEDRVVAIDSATLGVVDSFTVGDRPSGLAISEDGRTIYVTHLLDGTISILDTGAVRRLYLPVMTKGTATNYHSPASSIQPASPHIQLRRSTVALWPDSNLAQSIVLSPDGARAYVPHTRSNTGNRALTFDTTVFPLVSLMDTSARQHLVGQQLALETIDPPGVGLPFDAAFTPDGRQIWVLNAASNDISVVDVSTRQRVAHIEVGDNPRGIVLTPDGATAYVNNTLAGTVSVLDTASYWVTAVISATDIPLPPVLLNGKRLFHSSDDSRMARAQWISCNTCHFETEHDGRTWFFGFAGPRNTTSLLGMIETYPLRWSAEWDESADSEFANRRENFGNGLIQGEMHCALSPPDCANQPPNQGRSYDLDSLAAFIDSLRIPLSPTHTDGRPLNVAEQRGQAIFSDPGLRCLECHPPPLYTDLQMHDVGTATADERIGPAYDTPTLRGLYGSAPYFHDGSAATLIGALTRPSPGKEHDVSGQLSEAEIADLAAFLRALPFEPAAQDEGQNP
jgi:YVTN family beta-propeller protein